MFEYVLFLFLAAAKATTAIEVGDEFCVSGFIMDFFCIDRTTLLDNPSVKTLEEPEFHSVHCLVDVGSCVRSPFEVLLDPPPDQELYMRGFRLDGPSKDMIVNLARDTGDRTCTTCNGMGDLRRGFRAAMVAEVTSLDEGADIPPIISVSEALTSHNVDDACGTLFGMTDIAVELAESNITIGIITDPAGRTQLQKQHFIHGSLMLIGWGFLLPIGTIFAKLFKHRPDGLWLKIHRFCQTVGLCFAVIGWIVALRNFQVFADKGYNNYRHGIMGMTTMCLGLLQPINAVLRPHLPEKGGEASTARKIWEVVHKGLGYTALLLAICTIGLGTTILPNVYDQKKFQMAYGIGAGSIIFLLVAALIIDKRLFPSGNAENHQGDIEKEDHIPLSS